MDGSTKNGQVGIVLEFYILRDRQNKNQHTLLIKLGASAEMKEDVRGSGDESRSSMLHI